MSKKTRYLIILLGSIFGTFVVTLIFSVVITSLYYEGFLADNSSAFTYESLSGEPEKATNKLTKVESIIENLYYEDYDDKSLVDGAIRGIVNELGDPYSVYFSADEVAEFKASLENKYVGIGVQIEYTMDYTYVTRVFEGTPAIEAGVEVGDIFSTVDGESVVGYNAQEISSIVRGEEGTDVEIGFIRPGFDEEILLNITRRTYTLDSLHYQMLEDGVGYIQIVDFTSDISDEFESAYKFLKSKKMKSLIIDVRNNGGGYLDQVTKIVDMFVDDSKPIYRERSVNKDESLTYGTSKKENIELAVLINEGSASASELLAAALSEINGSLLVGKTTFGKGTAQRAMPLGDGSEIKITYAQWLSPDGNWIHDVGIEPDIDLDLNKEHSFRNVLVNEKLAYDTVNQQVVNAQEILNLQGYDVRSDGYFDKKTENAIKDFQGENDVSKTGKIDSKTAALLNSYLDDYLTDYKNDLQLMTAFKELTDE